MYFPPKRFLTRMLEIIVGVVVAIWLIKIGLCMLEDIWGWIILIGVIVGGIVIGWKIHKHHKDTRGF